MSLMAPMSLEPNRSRVDEIDELWRRRLAGSLRYLAEYLGKAGHDVASHLELVCTRLDRGAVSPWVFCLYSQLVAEVTAKDFPSAVRSFEELVRASDTASVYRAVAIDDVSVPAAWWDQFRRLVDTDHARAIEAEAPNDVDTLACENDVERAVDLLRRASPEWADELSALLRMVVIGVPVQRDDSVYFDAVSSYFAHGVVLVNGARRRSPLSMIDLLVHETSHILLFGLTVDQSLTDDRGGQRYHSPVRSDPRPIEGIFHAGFVATRVSFVMDTVITSGMLTSAERDEAVERRERNSRAAKDALGTLDAHASPTVFGAEVLNSLRGFWAAAA